MPWLRTDLERARRADMRSPRSACRLAWEALIRAPVEAAVRVCACGMLLVAMPVLAADKDGSGPPGGPARHAGLVWVRFHDPHLRRPAESGCDAAVELQQRAGAHDWSQVWRGQLRLPADDVIRLDLEADDGAELWVGDRLVIDGWCRSDTPTGTVQGRAGEWVPVEVRLWNVGGEARCRLLWSWGSRQREIVPAEALSHTESDEVWMREIAAGRRRLDLRREDRSALYEPGRVRRTACLRLTPGRYLFIDDYWVEHSSGVVRRVNCPRRTLPGPIVTGRSGAGDNCFEPYLSVVRDPASGRFRMWYGVPESASQSHIAYMESDDGVNWERPHRVLADPSPIQFGVSVIDEGPDFVPAAQRFKLGYYGLGAEGLRVAVSADGLDWKPLVDRTVIPHDHDINNIWRDTIRGQYMAILSTYTEGPRWQGRRRITMQSVSHDLINWQRPWIILTPDDAQEEGETQFYAMCGFLACGNVLVGMVKVLHDDYAAEPGGEVAGVGWTSLAWSRDGMHWVRDRQVFFDRNDRPGEWDRAMAWIDWQLPVGDEVYLYYGGYARGHKVNRFEERQIGMVRMKRDRYVAFEAEREPGLLRTPPAVLEGQRLLLNVDAAGGEVEVRLVDEGGCALPGFDFADCQPICEDALDAPVRWRRSIADVGPRPVRIEFRLRAAKLFAMAVE